MLANIKTGTSFSAPHAAAAALLKTWDKSLTQDDIIEIFKEYSVDLGDEGYDEIFGWGMVNLADFEVEGSTPPEKTRCDYLHNLVVKLIGRKSK